MNRLKKTVAILFLLSFLFLAIGCTRDLTENLFGKYRIEIKGVEINDETKGFNAFQYFVIKPDHKFQIFDDESDVKIDGTWEVIDNQIIKNNLGEYVPESTVEFITTNKKIKGIYRENRLTFTHPNDFYKGRYKSTWYIKLKYKD